VPLARPPTRERRQGPPRHPVRVPSVENAVGEILQLAAEVVRVLETLLALVLALGRGLLKWLAEHVRRIKHHAAL
jgi:hypothetical protein